MKRPATAPCRSCPYRQDVPSGVWDPVEYAKLPAYDGTIVDQANAGAAGVFHCHLQDGRICAGWAGCHPMDDSLALRLAAAAGKIAEDELDATLDYRTDVPLFPSGAAAAAHGLANVKVPGPDAVQAIQRLERRSRRRS